jgi:thioredoxin 1
MLHRRRSCSQAGALLFYRADPGETAVFPAIADDTSFNRLVLKSPVPSIALCIASSYVGCWPCLPGFKRLAERYRGQVGSAVVDIDASRLIAESFGVQAVPAYLLFRGGELLAHSLGYLPEPLLDLFFQMATEVTAPSYGAWCPTEQVLEDALIVPMLARWGWAYQRQYQCSISGAPKARRGVIDFLVSTGAATQPLTLFENKRRICGREDLQRAAAQALSYALALGLSSFVVADATRLWVYQVYEGRATLAQQFEGYELEHDDRGLRDLLLALGAAGPSRAIEQPQPA